MLFYVFLPLFYITFTRCDPDIIIVGGGASGIAAATKLLKRGFNNITILEAENRTGGRIYSVQFDKSYVDLGAEWCHGQKENIVYELVRDLNILHSTPMYFAQIYHSKVKALDKTFSDALTNICLNLVEEISNQTANLGTHLVKRHEEVISEWKGDLEKYTVARQAIDLCHSYVASDYGAFSWFDIASNSDFIEDEENHLLDWNGLGYKTILEILEQKYPDPSKSLPIDDKILLNKEVKQIHWNSDQSVVKCTDGSIYSADHVIVTVSLGVLKHQHDDLFVPKLPANKVEAIDQLGFAAVHKVLLHFSEKWWNDSYPGSAFIWDEEDKKASLFTEGPIKNGKSWVTALSVLVPIPHHPNVLEVWIAGEFVPDIEKISDEVFINGIMHILEYFQVVDVENVKRPDAIARNNWYSNPHFRGTYSFQTPRSRRGEISDEVVLSMPLGINAHKPNLLFAGEATNPTHYATVHGAIESGFREADRILNMYK